MRCGSCQFASSCNDVSLQDADVAVISHILEIDLKTGNLFTCEQAR